MRSRHSWRRVRIQRSATAFALGARTGVCTPNSLSQEVGLALGAQAGEARLREVFEEAGFSDFRRAAETPLNLILEAKPWQLARRDRSPTRDTYGLGRRVWFVWGAKTRSPR